MIRALVKVEQGRLGVEECYVSTRGGSKELKVLKFSSRFEGSIFIGGCQEEMMRKSLLGQGRLLCLQRYRVREYDKCKSSHNIPMLSHPFLATGSWQIASLSFSFLKHKMRVVYYFTLLGAYLIFKSLPLECPPHNFVGRLRCLENTRLSDTQVTVNQCGSLHPSESLDERKYNRNPALSIDGI